MPEPTSRDAELKAQALWRPRPGVVLPQAWAELLDNEFLSPLRQRRRLRARLQALLAYAAANVPYYRERFAQAGLQPRALRGVRDLQALPVLDKEEIHRTAGALEVAQLPRGEQFAAVSRSSGTTGHPIEIRQTRRSMHWFWLLVQRHHRWVRLDPSCMLGVIREPGQMPKLPDGRRLGIGDRTRARAWPYVGAWFETGPASFFSNTNPPDDQARWLDQERPDYLVGLSSNLEELAYAISALGIDPRAYLKGVIAISMTLNESMRARIVEATGAPVHQGYGLNEVGIVAGRCDAGNYHVHAEHCCVEIVDQDNRHVGPGQTGRLLVTGFNNLLMPLIRYDTGDMARNAAGPCECGRTLPHFADVVGRSRRYLLCPPGTSERVFSIRRALDQMPPGLAVPLRRYQLHQYRDGRYQLRFKVTAPLPEEFLARVRESWARDIDPAPPLDIVQLERLEMPRGGKFESFTSDYYGF